MHTKLLSTFRLAVSQLDCSMFVNLDQDSILAFAKKCDDYLYIPPRSSKPMDGCEGRLGVLFQPIQCAVDWKYVQPALAGHAMADAASTMSEKIDILSTCLDSVIADANVEDAAKRVDAGTIVGRPRQLGVAC